MTPVEAVAARLRELMPKRAIYEWGPPNEGRASRYVVVSGNVGDEWSSTDSGSSEMRQPSVWARCISWRDSPDEAINEANRDASDVRDALRNWRPPLGVASWRIEPNGSNAAYREEGMPSTAAIATEQFLITFQA